MATTYITRDIASPGNFDKWTFSCWIKRSSVDEDAQLLQQGSSSSNYDQLRIKSGGALQFEHSPGGSVNGDYKTSKLYMDVGAWYHIVFVWDSGNATADDRMIAYTNGVRETNLSTYSAPTLNQDSIINDAGSDRPMVIGAASYDGGSSHTQNFNGVMSHVQFVDGQALAPTEFGEFDSTSGIWKIKTSCYATPGTNGFCLKMEDRTNLDLDSSSNAHTFTTGGTLTATYDNPSNNFATFNPLQNYIPAHTFSNGNDTITTTNASETYSMSIMGVSAGKWYFEALLDASTYSIYSQIGIAAAPGRAAGDYIGQETWAYGTGFDNTGQYRQDGLATSYGNTWTGGDYLGCYMDLDNNKVYFAINGVIQNSGTGISITAAANTTGYGNYFFCIGERHSDDSIWYCNFGNGYFGTTAIGSPEEDAGGIGAFKYDPSAGTFDGSSKDFRALCTKNIKAYGG